MATATVSPIAEGFSTALQAYLSLLRAEILQAQKMRMQSHGAKIVFLGGLFAFALPRNDAVALLVAPFVAFVFDCMAYGLTYNIHEIGAYIRDHIEPSLPQSPVDAHGSAPPSFLYWQTARCQAQHADWGRIFARFGNYAVSSIACIVAFKTNWVQVHTTIVWPLLVVIVVLYGILLAFEFRTQNLSRRSRRAG